MEPSGLPPRTNASIKHLARQAGWSYDYDNAPASYNRDMHLCLLWHQSQQIMLLPPVFASLYVDLKNKVP